MAPKTYSRLGVKLVRKSIESGSGRVSVAYAERVGTPPTACLFIAHGVKSSMNSSLVDYFHSGLAFHGFLTVKFNFPYAEGRWRFARKPDRTEVLVECYWRVVEDTRKSEWKLENLFLGGISMGRRSGRMSSQMGRYSSSEGTILSQLSTPSSQKP